MVERPTMQFRACSVPPNCIKIALLHHRESLLTGTSMALSMDWLVRDVSCGTVRTQSSCGLYEWSEGEPIVLPVFAAAIISVEGGEKATAHHRTLRRFFFLSFVFPIHSFQIGEIQYSLFYFSFLFLPPVPLLPAWLSISSTAFC